MYCFSHLFNAALAEFEFVTSFLLYLGKANKLSGKASESLCAAYREPPASGMALWLPDV